MNGLSECLYVQFIIILATQVLSQVDDMMFCTRVVIWCLPGWGFVKLSTQFLCLFSSEAEDTERLQPGDRFNYNHSIPTLCSKVTEVDRRKGSEGKHITAITQDDPMTPCYSTHTNVSSSCFTSLSSNNISILRNMFSCILWELLRGGRTMFTHSIHTLRRQVWSQAALV